MAISAKVISIDNVGMTAIVCRRSSRTTIRKFKATCGSVIEFGIASSGEIVSTKLRHELCKSNCPACEDRTRLAKKLIESGK